MDKVAKEAAIHIAEVSMVAEFCDVFFDELSDGLHLLCGIQCQTDLEPGVALPNRRRYRIRLKEHEELRRQVEEMLAKCFIQERIRG